MKTTITKPRSLSSLKIRRFPLGDTARAANPNTPTTWERMFRCAHKSHGMNTYSVHKTREEAEASAACCRGRTSVFETLEEFFVFPDEVKRKFHPTTFPQRPKPVESLVVSLWKCHDGWASSVTMVRDGEILDDQQIRGRNSYRSARTKEAGERRLAEKIAAARTVLPNAVIVQSDTDEHRALFAPATPAQKPEPITIAMGPATREQLQKAVTFFDTRLYEIQNAGTGEDLTICGIRILFNEILSEHGCTATPNDE